MFVAHWCPHCQREVPLLAKWLKGGQPAGVELYSVATSTSAQQANYPPSAWLAREGWTVPVLTDDEASGAAQAYGLTSFPYFVFIDSSGKVVQRMAGEQPVSAVQAELAKLAKPAS
jgi:thiol-disulfide isomerase/thioredoxin